MLNKDAKPGARLSRRPAALRATRSLQPRAAVIQAAFARLLGDDDETRAALADLVAPRQTRGTQH